MKKLPAALGLLMLACMATQARASDSTSPDACKALKHVLKSSLDRILLVPARSAQGLAQVLAAFMTPEQRLELEDASPSERLELLKAAFGKRLLRKEMVDGKERLLVGITHRPRTTPVGQDPDRTYMDELMLDPAECGQEALCRLWVKRERGSRTARKFDVVAADIWVEYPYQQNRLELQQSLQPGDIDQQALDELPISSPETASLKERRLRLSAIRIVLNATTLTPTLHIDGMIHGLSHETSDGAPSQRGHAVGGTLDQLISQVYLPAECRR